MLTKQFPGFCTGSRLINDTNSTSTASSRKRLDGVNGIFSQFGSWGGTQQPVYVAIGSGNTDPTIDDYTLETPLTNVLTRISMQWNWGSYNTDNKLGWVSTLWRNNTDAPVTVKEIGIYMQGQYNDTANTFCIARSILETPVTIGVGETYNFYYEVAIA